MDFATLYEEDVETWAKLQVAALQRLATRPGPWSNVVDWENVIEQIDGLSSDRKAAESLLRIAFAHVLKASADPESLSVPRWRIDASDLLDQAQRKLKLDQELKARKALQLVVDPDASALHLPPGIPCTCPFALDELLAEDFTYDLAVERLYIRLTSWRPKAREDEAA